MPSHQSQVNVEKLELQDFDRELPERVQVAAILEKKPSSHPWADYSFDAIGVVLREGEEDRSVTRVFQDGEVEHDLVTGLEIQLHVDECESYYHNLMSPEPGCFLVADQPDDSDDMPVPHLASLSFDEAHAYLEGDEVVYSVPIPRELYQWAEAYVLTHYVAIKKTKRKLKDWRQSEEPGGDKA